MSDEKRIDRIESKIDKIVERVSEIDKTLERNTASLEDHIRRTEILENDIRPVKRHVYMLEGILKLIGVLAMLAAVAKLFIK